jgi:hypothetical protein
MSSQAPGANWFTADRLDAINDCIDEHDRTVLQQNNITEQDVLVGEQAPTTLPCILLMVGAMQVLAEMAIRLYIDLLRDHTTKHIPVVHDPESHHGLAHKT